MLTESRRKQLEELWPELRQQLRSMIVAESNKAQRMTKQPDRSYKLTNTEPRSISPSDMDDLISSAVVWIVIQLDDLGSLTADPRLLWRSVANALADRSSPWNGPSYNHTATGLVSPESATEGRIRTFRVAREYTATVRRVEDRSRRLGAIAADEKPEHIAAYCMD